MGASISTTDRIQVSDLRSGNHWRPSKINGPLVVEIKNKNQWKSRLNALKDTNKLLVIQFTAKWCYGPCKSLEPKLEELAAKYTDVEFVKIDVDIIMSIWMEKSLHTLPAIVFMKRGQELDRVEGVNVEELERKLYKYTQTFF